MLNCASKENAPGSSPPCSRKELKSKSLSTLSSARLVVKSSVKSCQRLVAEWRVWLPMPALTIDGFSMPNVAWLGSACGGMAVAAGCGGGAGAPLGTGAGAAAFCGPFPKVAVAAGVMGVAGVGTSGSGGASAAGVVPALRFAVAFFWGAF